MNHRLKSYWQTTIGQKQLVALTGMGLSLFVFMHMAGNLLMFISPQKYNEYGHGLVSNPLFIFAELGLLAAFLGHVVLAMRMTRKNWKARPEAYTVKANGEKGTDFISKSMWLQGLVIFVFLILHVITFKYGPYYAVNYGSGEIRDLFRVIVEAFKQPLYVAWYIVALLVLGLHLSHGVKSTIQTLGLFQPRYQCLIKVISIGFALAVAGGFIAQPIYVFFFYEG